MALTLSACGTRANFNIAGGGEDLGGVDTGNPVAPSTASALPSAASSAAASQGASVPGQTATSSASSEASSPTEAGGATSSAGATTSSAGAPIRLVYIEQGTAGASALTGSNVSGSSSASSQTMLALVSYANAHGGVGGRKISAVGVVSQSTSQDSARVALCKHITEDLKAQVVIDADQMTQSDDMDCFAEHKTVLMNLASYADSTFLSQTAPYVITTWLDYDRAAKAMVVGAQSAGWFKGGKVGLIFDDDPIAHAAYTNVIKPALAQVGITNEQAKFIVIGNTSEQASQTSSAELSFSTAGINRILWLSNIIPYLAFTSTANSQGYHPEYAFNDYVENVGVAAFYGSAQQNTGAIGISSSFDSIADTATPGSTTSYNRKTIDAGSRRCLDLLTAVTKKNYYSTSSSGDTAATWSYYCDEFLLWWQAAQNVGASWTPQLMGQGLSKVGTSYLSDEQHSTDFGTGVYDGASSYRVGKYNSGCKCFVKITNWLALPS